jgi:hypothetical protein
MDNIGFGGYFLYLVSLFLMQFGLTNFRLTLAFPEIIRCKKIMLLIWKSFFCCNSNIKTLTLAFQLILYSTLDFIYLTFRGHQYKESVAK